MPKYTCYFNTAWLENDSYKSWLVQDSSSDKKGYCKFCKKSIDVSNMGELALKSHSKSEHSQRVITSKGCLSMKSFTVITKTEAQSHSSSCPSTSSTSSLVHKSTEIAESQAVSETESRLSRPNNQVSIKSL